MHALAKMPDYICQFGSGMNFYGGPGEASHKQFVKAPGLKTQRRVIEFASQTAKQYYTIMAIARQLGLWTFDQQESARGTKQVSNMWARALIDCRNMK